MQLAVSFIWDRKIGPRCSKRGVQLQTFSDLPLNHPRNLHGLWDTCDFRSSFVNMRRWNWWTVTTCRGIPGSLITFPFVRVYPQMESEHQVIKSEQIECPRNDSSSSPRAHFGKAVLSAHRGDYREGVHWALDIFSWGATPKCSFILWKNMNL